MIWEETKCMDLLRGQQVIEIAADASLSKGCEQLVSHGISSAPVYSAVSKSYVGMLDYRDLVSFVLVAFHERHLERISEDPAASSTPSKPSPNSVIDATLIRKVLTGGLENVQSRQVADLSHRNPFLSVNQDSPLSYAIDILGKNGVHRLNVLGADKRVVGVLSQTDILRFIADERQPFADLMSKRLEDVVGVINRKPLSVRSESTVLRAMELMNQENVSSIAVVDAFGGLVGNVSMADIRFIFRNESYNRLWMSCMSFISAALSQKGLEAHGQDRFPFFDVRPGSTVQHAIDKMLAVHCHRLWVVNDVNHLEGVVSQTDLIEALVDAYPVYSEERRAQLSQELPGSP